MQPENVHSVISVGENFEYALFRVAISLAESGLEVWFISPKAFDKAPKNLKIPDKEILKLITFMYLKDYNDLVTQLNGVHLWRKIPSVIIVTGYEHYCNLSSVTYKPAQAALTTTTLLDSAAVCAMKKSEKIVLLAVCSEPVTNLERLQVLKDLYFHDYVHKIDDDKFYDDVMRLLK